MNEGEVIVLRLWSGLGFEEIGQLVGKSTSASLVRNGPSGPAEELERIMSGPEDANELKSLEARLANLEPREDRLDRERLMFLMGQASERGERTLPRRGEFRAT